jgi:predicted RNA binding protein YcfA (HicA-like mRNA interferase family)
MVTVRKARSRDGIIKNNIIWTGTPTIHHVKKDFPYRLELDAPYVSDFSGKIYKLWITDDATWRLLPPRFRKLRLSVSEFLYIIRDQYSPEQIKSHISKLEDKRQKLIRLGRIKFGRRSDIERHKRYSRQWKKELIRNRGYVYDVERDSVKREISDLRHLAQEQGWHVELTKGSHWKFIPPDKSKSIVILPGTSVSRSGIRNARAELRRSGLPISR